MAAGSSVVEEPAREHKRVAPVELPPSGTVAGSTPALLPPQVKIEVVSGVEGPSVYINDMRVAGPKPWGGGKVIYLFKAEARHILEALPDLRSRDSVTEDNKE
jgi:hypothetical protein